MSLYGGVGGAFGSFIAYGSDGLRLDLPIYLNLTATGSTALRVQKDASSVIGSFNTANYWRVDLENEYGTGTDSSGMFEIMNLNQKDAWGLRLNNRTLFANGGRFQGSIEYPNHENIFSNLNYSQTTKNFYYSFSGRSSYYKSRRDTYYLNGYIQSNSLPLSKYFDYNLSNQIYYDATFLEKKSRPGVRLGVNLYSKYFDMGFAKFNISSSYTQNIQKIYNGNSLTLNAGLNTSLGSLGNLGLHYSYLNEKSLENYESSYISSDISYGFSNIGFRANGTYSFSNKDYNAFAECSWSPIDYWALRAMGSYQYSPDGDSYYDYKVSIGRQVGIQEYRIAWTYSTNRIDFEIGTIGF